MNHALRAFVRGGAVGVLRMSDADGALPAARRRDAW